MHFVRTHFVKTVRLRLSEQFKNNRLDASNQKSILMTIRHLFKTEILKHKYIHSILQKNKFSTINIKFKFRILVAPLMDKNMDVKIWISLI